MRSVLKLCLIMVVVVAAWSLAPPPAIGADAVTGTHHDFTTTGASTAFQGAATTCGTCHYPHNTGSAQLIWNHSLSANTLTFGASATTLAGTTLPADIGAAPGTSKNCLSCHDGSVAVGDMIKGTDWGTTKITGNALIGSSGNISGTHPVEVPYPGSTYNSIISKATAAEFQTTPTGVKLYGSAGAQGIGCASCHNPHNDTTMPFLRVAYASLCTSCHIK